MRDLIDIMERAAIPTNSRGWPIAATEEGLLNFQRWFGKSCVKDKSGRPLVVFHGTDAEFTKFDPSWSNRNSNTGVPSGAFVFSDHGDVSSSYAMARHDVQGWRDEETTQAFRDLMKTGSWEDQLQFLADHPSGYDEYKDGGNVMPVYLRILKPLIVDAKGYHWHDVYFQPKGYTAPESFTTNEIAQIAKEQGYDGCIVKNVKDVSKGPAHMATTYFVFSPSQIKSAIGNNGSFGPSDSITEGAPAILKRNALDAIDHADEYGDQKWSLDDFTATYLGELSVDEIGQYDDLSSWLEVHEPSDLYDFRDGSFDHGPEKAPYFPPVLIITAPTSDGKCHTQVGDGRGRTNYANAHGVKLHVYHLVHKSCGTLNESVETSETTDIGMLPPATKADILDMFLGPNGPPTFEKYWIEEHGIMSFNETYLSQFLFGNEDLEAQESGGPFHVTRLSLDPRNLYRETRSVSDMVVNRYSRLASKAPPVLVRKDGDSWKLVEGGHRVAAAVKRGETLIDAVDVTAFFAMTLQDWSSF